MIACAGCRAPIDDSDYVTHFGPAREHGSHYHEACWQTGWYTGIEPEGEWPIETEADPVHSPAHYRWLPNGIEVIDITETLNFCMGNAIKYILRADHKGKPEEDISKAIWYLQRELSRRSVTMATTEEKQ